MYHLTPKRTCKMLEENVLILQTSQVDNGNFLYQSILNTLSCTSHTYALHKFVIIIFLELMH
jgi:hypothetical protein